MDSKKHQLSIRLLRDRDEFWKALHSDNLGWKDILSLIIFVVFACALYGVVLAGWRSPRLALYVAIKLPFLFLGTTALVAVFNWMIASALGSGLSFRSMVLVVFASMTIGCWILLCLAPLAIFFLLTAVPATGTHEELRYSHNVILVTHIVILAMAGVTGNIALLKGLRSLIGDRCNVPVLFLSWLAAFAFVGCQLSWMLRPFVGSPFFPVAFMRSDALSRNFYEFLLTDVFPFLLNGVQ